MPLRSAFLVAVLCGFWPVFQWYLSRVFDASDEPWGLLALSTVAAILVYESKQARRDLNGTAGKIARCLLFSSMSCYVISLLYCPHLVQAVLMVIILWSLMMLCMPLPSGLGIMGLLLLSLPAVASLNFFAGYPLRLLISSGAGLMLSAAGMTVDRQGAMLILNHQLISVDAPCSGVNMLWASAYLASVSMCFCRLNWGRALLLSVFAFIMVIVANILRVSALSYFTVKAASMDPQFAGAEPTLHLGAGLSVFLLVGFSIAWLAQKLKMHIQDDAVKLSATTPVLALGHRQALALLLLSLVAGIVPFFSRPAVHESGAAIVWPEEINGCRIRVNADAPDDSKFAEGFPGQSKRFTDGKNAYIVRWVKSETRQLHPSSDCFKSLGYGVEFGPLVEMPNGSRWSSFTASKDKSKLRVLEQIHDEHGVSWTDVSEWYWSACFGKTKGPWWDIVIARAIE